jgi:hypothetical protein
MQWHADAGMLKKGCRVSVHIHEEGPVAVGRLCGREHAIVAGVWGVSERVGVPFMWTCKPRFAAPQGCRGSLAYFMEGATQLAGARHTACPTPHTHTQRS